MGKQTKFSPCERKFVCQHKMARDCKTVIQLVHLHGGFGEGKLQAPKISSKLASDLLDGVSSHFVLTRERKFSLLAPSHDESEILYKAKFAYYRSILGFCSFPSSKCEKITPNVTKQNWNSYKFLFSIGSENFFFDLCSCKNVNFKSLFPISPQHNFGKFSSNTKSKDSFEIRIVLVFRKCPKF